MSKAFLKAQEYVREQLQKGVPKITIQERMPEFEADGFVVNRVYFVGKPIIGMAKNMNVKFDKNFIALVRKFAKFRNLDVEVIGGGIFLKRGEEIVAWLREDFFGADEPTLFEELSKEVYGPYSNNNRKIKSDLTESFLELLRDSRSGVRFIAFMFVLSIIAAALAAPFAALPPYIPRWSILLIVPIVVTVLLYAVKLYAKSRRIVKL
ncbi:MAG: hypothetical protein RMJ14_00365 [Nitrososphaerota archaeon]|nr:hypothetical protein [Aigarchaeota archaeon]MDW8076083.1 hypothetical protein [Nitrososphaerota archaeon]